jgi:hypothetical protein
MAERTPILALKPTLVNCPVRMLALNRFKLETPATTLARLYAMRTTVRRSSARGEVSNHLGTPSFVVTVRWTQMESWFRTAPFLALLAWIEPVVSVAMLPRFADSPESLG